MKNFITDGDVYVNIYVAHLSGAVMCIGEREECEAFKNSQSFPTDNWVVCDVETFGDNCFSAGYDSGHDAGYDDGAFNNY